MRNKNLDKNLPWQYPKSPDEDPHAQTLVKNLKESSGYKVAAEDPVFMESYDSNLIILKLNFRCTLLVWNTQ